jgi:hypothetical protein
VRFDQEAEPEGAYRHHRPFNQGDDDATKQKQNTDRGKPG